MMGLVDMVDALGGIDVNLKKALHITYHSLAEGEPKKSYTFNVGVNHLDGLEALAYARDRSDSDDYVRMGRQRCVIMAMLYQNSVAKLTLQIPEDRFRAREERDDEPASQRTARPHQAA